MGRGAEKGNGVSKNYETVHVAVIPITVATLPQHHILYVACISRIHLHIYKLTSLRHFILVLVCHRIAF